MATELYTANNAVTVRLEGELDHHAAGPLRDRIDEAIMKARPDVLTLDFGNVSFMDSSAVGLVMGRFKLLSAMKGKLEVVGLSPTAYRMMELSGLKTLAKLEMKPRGN
ncbi:MAG: anti-sigma factor antagonist [Oscillospiraceae bacterium]|nr:anti-sigma factor antagonist [Oscillospiraceae bacterium]